MARIKRIYYNNATYHVSIRGNNRQAVLKADEDKKEFLRVLKKFRTRFRFALFGFILMDNHAHLVVSTNCAVNISKIMQAIALSYSQKFRRKYGYTGYVWQGRFKSNVIENQDYILNCLEYIHNNPVRAGLVNHPKEYLWSSYHFYHAGESNLMSEYIQIDKFAG
ncbi:MAG: transposase [Candidatus Omnitrophica bacterium]|nr:transposase [Candidatus Omnitrophota bacterium]